MAQQDTGLGWSAENDWLISTGDTQIAEYTVAGGPSYPGQPIPCVPALGDTDIVLAGFKIFHNNYTGTDAYIGAAQENVFVGKLPVVGSYIVGISPTSPINVRVVYVRSNGTIHSSQGYVSGNPANYDSSTGLYWFTFGPRQADTNYMPEFADVRTALDSLVIATNTFKKVNAGYAVACTARWLTQNGTELSSPILISSNTDFVDMTTTATGHYIAKLNMLLSGVHFYMGFWDFTGNIDFETPLQEVDLTGRGNMTLEQLFMTIISTSYAHVIIINSPDPYEEEGGAGGEEGGDGEETGDDDAGIEAGSDFPSAINTGFCRIFSPSESELRNLSNYLWSNSYDLAQVKKLFSNPMDSILGLSAVPIRLLGSSVSFSLGGVPITGMTLPMVSQQRYTYHMGSITIKERWGSYLDYDPYTKFSIFLPFIGMRELAADDIMGKTVSLVYDIDILTGMCVARLQAGTNCLYEWGGNCAIQLPINSRNWDSVFSTAVSAVGGIMTAVTGGSAPLVAGSVASAALQTVSMKPRIDKSSTIGGAAGWLGQMTPYIIRTTPEAFIPTDQNKFIGYPAYINVNLGAISGYNEVDSIHLENVTATGAELDEIESILKGGVIF